MTLGEATEKYITSRSKRFSPNSIKTYSRVLGKFSNWLGNEREFASIKEVEIDHFQLMLKDEYKINTQINYANILRAFFKFWVKRGECDLPVEAIEGPKREEQYPNYISKEKFDLIDDYFDDHEYFELTKKVIYNLLWDTGMRIGELLSLNVEDIHSDSNFTKIRTEKSKKLRVVVWSNYTHGLLMKYLGVRLCLNQASALFQTPQGTSNQSQRTRLTARSVQRWCVELGRELGFKINPHAFRHGKMHQIICQGGTRQHVQSIAGHSSINSSEVYVRLNESEQVKMQTKFLRGSKDSRSIHSKFTVHRKKLVI